MAKNKPIAMSSEVETSSCYFEHASKRFLHFRRNDKNCMLKVNLNEIKEEPWQSPGGKYAVSFKGLSEALGRDPSSLDLAKRHPFDLEWNRVPPGKPNFPYHAHSAQ